MNKESINPFHLTTVSEKKKWLKNKGLIVNEKEETFLDELLLNYPFEKFLNQVSGFYTGNEEVPFLNSASFSDIYDAINHCDELVHIIYPFLMKTLFSFRTQLFHEIAKQTSNFPLATWHLIEKNYYYLETYRTILSESTRILEKDKTKGVNKWFHDNYSGEYPIWLFIERVEEAKTLVNLIRGLKKELLQHSQEKLNCVKVQGVADIYELLSNIRNVVCHGSFFELQRFKIKKKVDVNNRFVITSVENKINKSNINGILALMMYVSGKYCSRNICEKFINDLKAFLNKVKIDTQRSLGLTLDDDGTNMSTIQMLWKILNEEVEVS